MDNWILISLLAFTLLAVSTAIDKHFMNKGYQPLSTNLFKMFFDGVILLGLGYFFIGLNLSWELFLWALVLGGLYALSGVLYFKAIKITDVEMIFPYIQSLVTLISVIGSVIFFQEIFELPNYLGVGLIFIGIYLVLSKDGLKVPEYNKGMLYGGMIVVTMTIYALLTKFLLSDIRPIDLSVMMYLSSGLLIGFYKLIFDKKHRLPQLKSAKIIISAAFGATGTFLMYTALASGLASKVYALAGWESVVIFILASIALKQKLLIHRLIGILLILPGIYLVSI